MVDLDVDDRVFALLDDGCNCICHTSIWAWKAQYGFNRVSKEFGELVTTNAIPKYKGIGSVKGVGKRYFPCRVALQDGALAKGSLMSNELDNAPGNEDRCLHLSLAAQRILGVVKD